MDANDWEDITITMESVTGPVADFLKEKGLEKYAAKIVEATEAETLDDLKLIDAKMAEEVIAATDMKLVPAKKFRAALAELRGEVSSVPEPLARSASSGAAAAAEPPAVPGAAPAPAAGPPPTAAPDAAAAAAAVVPTPAQKVPVPAAQPAEPIGPEECIVVCIDRSGSMGAPFTEVVLNVVQKAVAQRTRMEAVKVMFYAFRDRADTVGRGTHMMGLVQFDDEVERLLELTPRLELFEAIVDNVEKRGSTAIYSAILEAVRMLEPYFQGGGPGTPDLRVLVLTDGQNNAGHPPHCALEEVNRIGAVVDAIIVGDRPDTNLRKIVSVTGGECYQIGDLGEGFELLEAEAVVSLKARRGFQEKPPFQLRETVSLERAAEKTMVRGTAVQRAPVLKAELAKSKTVDPATYLQTVSHSGASGSGGGGSGSAAVKRVLKELRDAPETVRGENIHIFPAQDQPLFWRALLEGPAGSPFIGGVFLINVQFPQDYPFKPPKIMFETPIYHCNVSDSGGICLDILKDNWSPALSAPKALVAISNLLRDPNPNDSLRQWIAELTLAHFNTKGADRRYYEKAAEHTQQHASKSVAAWRAEWGC